MELKKEFLIWLSKQDRYWIPDKEVHEKFPDLEYHMIGVTKRYNEESDEMETPKRDWRQAVKYGSVND